MIWVDPCAHGRKHVKDRYDTRKKPPLVFKALGIRQRREPVVCDPTERTRPGVDFLVFRVIWSHKLLFEEPFRTSDD